jgi:FKBP-type peptidyl-prolyl cis-trans isomerase
MLTLLIPVLISCRQAPGEENTPTLTPVEEKEMLLRVNKFLVKKDIELIESYARRRGWDMQVTESGLFYEVYETSAGSPAEPGMKIALAYKLSLLDGTVCYSSEKDGEKEFVLGKSQEISGLEQGVELMKVGEKARFIIPPHLAYGLLGDENRIPARSIIVYEVELLRAEMDYTQPLGLIDRPF